jgi:hypothetical protein
MGDATILSHDSATSTPDEIRALEVVAAIVAATSSTVSDASVCEGPR